MQVYPTPPPRILAVYQTSSLHSMSMTTGRSSGLKLQTISSSKRPFLVSKMYQCGICGEMTAFVRPSEIQTARITGRAHFDCNGSGHAQYRALTLAESADIETDLDEKARLLKVLGAMVDLEEK